jgi:hypothetical protein
LIRETQDEFNYDSGNIMGFDLNQGIRVHDNKAPHIASERYVNTSLKYTRPLWSGVSSCQ